MVIEVSGDPCTVNGLQLALLDIRLANSRRHRHRYASSTLLSYYISSSSALLRNLMILAANSSSTYREEKGKQPLAPLHNSVAPGNIPQRHDRSLAPPALPLLPLELRLLMAAMSGRARSSLPVALLAVPGLRCIFCVSLSS